MVPVSCPKNSKIYFSSAYGPPNGIWGTGSIQDLQLERFLAFLIFFEFDSSWDVPVVCVRVCFQKIKKITKNPLLLFLSTSKAKQQETAHSIVS